MVSDREEREEHSSGRRSHSQPAQTKRRAAEKRWQPPASTCAEACDRCGRLAALEANSGFLSCLVGPITEIK